MADNVFWLGARFDSYIDFIAKLHELELIEHQKFKRSHTRYLKQDDKGHENLVFAYATFCCELAGKYKPTGKGVRKGSSKKQECPALIKIQADDKRMFLKVTGLSLQHNHCPLKDSDSETLGSDSELDAPQSTRLRKRRRRKSPEDARKAALKPVMDNLAKVLVDSSTNEAFDQGLQAVVNVLNTLKNSEQNVAAVENSKSLSSGIDKQSNTTEAVSNNQLHLPDFINGNPSQSEDFEQSESGVRRDDNEIIAVAGSGSVSMLEFSSTENEMIASDFLESCDLIEPMEVDCTEVAPPKIPEKHIVESVETTNEAQQSASRDANIDLAATKMSLIVNRRGRSKGSGVIAVGLDRTSRKRVAFVDKCPKLQIRDMLSWLIDSSIIDMTFAAEHLIETKDLDLKNLKDSIADDSVDLSLLIPYCKPRAYASLKKAVTAKKKNDHFSCGKCNTSIAGKSVFCDRCLLWYHYKCANVKSKPKVKVWFCAQCDRKE